MRTVNNKRSNGGSRQQRRSRKTTANHESNTKKFIHPIPGPKKQDMSIENQPPVGGIGIQKSRQSNDVGLGYVDVQSPSSSKLNPNAMNYIPGKGLVSPSTSDKKPSADTLRLSEEHHEQHLVNSSNVMMKQSEDKKEIINTIPNPFNNCDQWEKIFNKPDGHCFFYTILRFLAMNQDINNHGLKALF